MYPLHCFASCRGATSQALLSAPVAFLHRALHIMGWMYTQEHLPAIQ